MKIELPVIRVIRGKNDLSKFSSMKSSPKKIRSLDVRPLLARGEEPFQKIMATVASLEPDEGLVLVAPFLPSPLIERLHAAGYQARPERAADGAWKTFFWRD